LGGKTPLRASARNKFLLRALPPSTAWKARLEQTRLESARIGTAATSYPPTVHRPAAGAAAAPDEALATGWTDHFAGTATRTGRRTPNPATASGRTYHSASAAAAIGSPTSGEPAGRRPQASPGTNAQLTVEQSRSPGGNTAGVSR